MKYFIVSDIHGSKTYCEKMLAAYENEKADKLVILGDILYHGPRNDLPNEYDAKEVTRLLNAHRNEILAVRGNCDAEIDQMVLAFPIMADYAIIESGNKTVFATHGHLYNRDHVPPIKDGDILLHGHTHIVADETYNLRNEEGEKIGTYTYLNPGSISIPKDGKRGYIILENGNYEWKALV